MNVYNVVFRQPALEAKDMPKGLEHLAQSLVKSGRLRIDADEKINFIRYPHSAEVTFFSHRELHDPALVPHTIKLIGEEDLQTMRREISTNQPVPVDLEIKLARLFVQSNHPIVIELILVTGVEIFLSFSYNIMDLLDLSSFQVHGANSGMQSIGESETRIYVSSDGDPFSTDKEIAEATKYSLARFMTIAGQETGHFADLRRDSYGRAYGRYSLDLYEYKASEKVRLARLHDIEWVNKVREVFDHLELNKTAKVEKSISFYEKYRKNSFKHFSAIIKSYLLTRNLRRRAVEFQIDIADEHSPQKLAVMLADMRFNLSPQADVYKDKDKVIEEAIACVEALARVPQQVNKWGHKTTRFMYPNLYRIYYRDIIHACTKALKDIYKSRQSSLAK